MRTDQPLGQYQSNSVRGFMRTNAPQVSLHFVDGKNTDTPVVDMSDNDPIIGNYS